MSVTGAATADAGGEVMNSATVETIILLGKIQEECRQVMEKVLETIEKSTDIFPNENEKGDGITFVLNRLQQALNEINPSSPSTSRTPPLFESLKTLLNLDNKKILHRFIADFYEKEKSKMSLEEYTKWKSLQPVIRLGGKVLEWQGHHLMDDILIAIYEPRGWAEFLYVAGSGIGYIGVLTIYNMWLCWTGSRSVKAAWKDVVDKSVTYFAGSVGGGIAVALAALLCGPLDWVTIFCIGGLAGAAVALGSRPLIENYTAKLFDLPSDQDVAKAYHLLGLPPSATDQEINAVYRKISKENHPDMVARLDPPPTQAQIKKSVELFIKVQKAVVLIRAHRDVIKANEGVNKGLPWKEQFEDFLLSFLRFRRKFMSNDEMAAIAFSSGFPSIAVFEEGADPTLSSLEATPNVKQVKSRWFEMFKAMIGKVGCNPFFAFNAS